MSFALDRVVDAAEIRRLDLHEIRRGRLREEPDVGKRVAPLVRDEADIDAFLLQQPPQAGELLDLLLLGLRDHRRFDEQLVSPGFLTQLADIIRERLHFHFEELSERAVQIDVDARRVIRVADFLDP